MAVIQVGSTLYADGTSSGLTQVIYGCDGCEAKTGDPYARLAWVERPPGGEWDDSELEGWAFLYDDEGANRLYCPDCAAEET
jgi:hypothetical protein